MAVLAKSGTPSLCTTNPGNECRISGLLAGEAIAAGDACYIKSDGKVWKSNGTALNAAAAVDGYAAIAAAVGESCTIYADVHFRYGAGMTPGTPFYLSTTAGLLADAATTGGTMVIARAIDATRIRVVRSW